MQSLPIKPPIIVHHMAALDGQPFPPNSLEAIQACLETNAPSIEIDVTALADKDYLLVHDPVLESETTGSGSVASCTIAEALTLCYKGAGQYNVPLLSDVVNAFLDSPATAQLQIDFKNMIPFDNDEPMQRLVNLIKPLNERVIVSTGADWQLRKLRKLAPWLDLGLDIHFYIDWYPEHAERNPEEYPKTRSAYTGYWDDHPIATQRHWPTAEYLEDRCQMLMGLVPRVSTFYISHTFLLQSLDDGFNWAEALHAAGIRLDAWTIDVGINTTEANVRRLVTCGVDQFTTNTPRALAALVI
jgi:glycerophosphoryl diester phosphodiesterase